MQLVVLPIVRIPIASHTKIYRIEIIDILALVWFLQPKLQPSFREVDPVFVWSARSLFDRV